jgi:hypothetical protein
VLQRLEQVLRVESASARSAGRGLVRGRLLAVLLTGQALLLAVLSLLLTMLALLAVLLLTLLAVLLLALRRLSVLALLLLAWILAISPAVA